METAEEKAEVTKEEGGGRARQGGSPIVQYTVESRYSVLIDRR